jgi:hypothetical protein
LLQAQENSDALGAAGGAAEGEGGEDEGEGAAEGQDQGQAALSTAGKEEVAEEEERPAADDLEVAWEVLELARMSYSQAPPTKENEIQLAETYSTIGEVGMESESFEQAHTHTHIHTHTHAHTHTRMHGI